MTKKAGWISLVTAVLFQRALSMYSVEQSAKVLGIGLRSVSTYRRRFGLNQHTNKTPIPLTDAQIFEVLDMLPTDAIERYVESLRERDLKPF